MRTLRNIKTPTGNILIVQGEKGKLEMLSLGDYGKAQNVKADFMGITRELNGVPHGELMPLEDKWVITISSQYGCSMKCNFCDVPRVGPGRNATMMDIVRQVLTGIKLHPEVKGTNRLNIHYARMGEPTWNPNILDATKWLKTHVDPEYRIHPVVSTMMPRRNVWLKTFIHTWMRIKNRLLGGNAGLQISINTTDPASRAVAFGGCACSLEEIARIMEGIIPNGRKVALNFAVSDLPVAPHELRKHFDPDDFMCKLTPMHMTNACEDNDIRTDGGYDHFYPYQEIEAGLEDAGYDVLVFVPSKEEDESRITCGNAILADVQEATE